MLGKILLLINVTFLHHSFQLHILKLSVKSSSLSPPIPSFNGICKEMKFD
jgi:hypothetical protein